MEDVVVLEAAAVQTVAVVRPKVALADVAAPRVVDLAVAAAAVVVDLTRHPS